MHAEKEHTAHAPSASAGQFPFSVWAKLMREVLLDDRDLLLQPPPNTGLPQLRSAIAGLLQRSRGMEVSPECIVIGAGAEYLYNILIQLLGRDHRYGLETPGHGKIRRIYEANQVTVCPVELDENGVSMVSLEQSGATVLHCSPGHQFPTGIVTPIGRRQQLMAWLAARDGRWLIEDDYDSEFRFSGRVIPSMHSMDDLDRVIYMNTFSRTITPALRISYMILPRHLMERYHRLLGFYSCAVPSFEQLTLARFLDGGHFERHVSRMKRRYRLLRDGLLDLLRQSPKAGAMTVSGADAGLHFLLKLDTKLTDEGLEHSLLAQGIRAVPLSRYEIAGSDRSGALVIQYSDLYCDELPGLAAALETLTEELP
jgi:GntR family transcriptional regulator/MocR family aminotransferase